MCLSTKFRMSFAKNIVKADGHEICEASIILLAVIIKYMSLYNQTLLQRSCGSLTATATTTQILLIWVWLPLTWAIILANVEKRDYFVNNGFLRTSLTHIWKLNNMEIKCRHTLLSEKTFVLIFSVNTTHFFFFVRKQTKSLSACCTSFLGEN